MKNIEILTDEVRALRAKYKLNQSDMASITNLSLASYRRKENGENQFTLKEAFLISIHFEKPIGKLFSYRMLN